MQHMNSRRSSNVVHRIWDFEGTSGHSKTLQVTPLITSTSMDCIAFFHHFWSLLWFVLCCCFPLIFMTPASITLTKNIVLNFLERLRFQNHLIFFEVIYCIERNFSLSNIIHSSYNNHTQPIIFFSLFSSFIFISLNFS